MAEFEFRDVKSDRSDQVELPNKYTDILDADFIIRGNLSNWEILHFRIRNESGNVHSLGAEKVTRSILTARCARIHDVVKNREHPTLATLSIQLYLHNRLDSSVRYPIRNS